jgi:Mlc titration factor MtfA (ptsG expression regulator)
VRLIRRLLQRFLAGPPVALPTEPIPQSWYQVLERWVPLSGQLDVDDRTRLLRLAQLFVHEVPMEGCAGLAMTDEIRVTIAATASLLLLRLPYPRFPRLRRVLVYPDTFVPVRIASYRSQEMVVLSWNDITAGGTKPEDGRNVILHEFAHVLDFEDGATDGLPILDSEQARVAWSAVLQAEFARQQDAATREEDATLDSYAATNRAEFFAVATETFFERGAHLRERLPDLYEQLRLFYRQDPASRTGLGAA